MNRILIIASATLGLFLTACSNHGGHGRGQNNQLFTMDTLVSGMALHMQTQPVEDGFGYVVAVNGKKMISQTVIPVIEGTNHFRTESDAFNIGCLVLRKMADGQQLPSVTREDLLMYNIIDQNGNIIEKH